MLESVYGTDLKIIYFEISGLRQLLTLLRNGKRKGEETPLGPSALQLTAEINGKSMYYR